MPRVPPLVLPMVFFGVIVAARADEALTLPPELRAGATAPAAPKAPLSKPKKAARSQQAAAPATPTATSATTPVAVPAVADPLRSKPQDDPLSFGMKWNADNQPNHGAATTDGLIDGYNKTLNNQPVGSGGEVGFKYKF